MRPQKDDVMRRLKPEPPSDEEVALAESIGPGEYEIFVERLGMIMAEAREVFTRTGISEVTLAGDLVVGLHTAQGDLVTSCLGTFLHTVTAQLPIKWIIQNYTDNPRVGVREGDIFYTNEALYGGIHNPDQLALMPIFYEGELIAWASSGVHTPETGGCDPGGFCPGARTRHDEGMKLTPIKIAEDYKIKDDLMEMMVNFCSRAPRMQEGDVRARMTACDRVRVRVQQLAKEKGANYLRGLMRKMLMDGEAGARARIKSWNDGIYRSVVFVDTIGREPGLWRMCVTAHKEDDRITIDFEGTSPEQEGFLNCMPWCMVAWASVYLYAHPFWDLPACGGTLAPIDWIMPEGTTVSASPEAATSGAVLVGELMGKLLPQVFGRMMYGSADRELCGGPIGFVWGAVAVAGINEWGVPVVQLPALALNTAGQGARVNRDGMDTSCFHASLYTLGYDEEMAEMDMPYHALFANMNTDSAGHGMYRGGAGIALGYFVYGAPFAIRTRFFHSGPVLCGNGLFGGYPAHGDPYLGINHSNIIELLKSGNPDVPMSPQEMATKRVVSGEYSLVANSGPAEMFENGFFTAGTAGGCGYGDVLERDPQAVVNDVRNGIVSEWVAKNLYQVDYDPESWSANLEATEELRARARQNRIEEGKSYEEFEKEWLQKKPKSDLHYYGSWPDAKPNRPIIRI